MNYEELANLIAHKTSLSDIDHPLLIQTLLDNGGVATVRKIAQLFLAHQDHELLHCEKRIKQIALRASEPFQLCKRQGEIIELDTSSLSGEQHLQLRVLCEQQLEKFRLKRGCDSSSDRLPETTGIPDDLRYKVFTRARGRCELCGSSVKDTAMNLDYIISRSCGGSDTTENLRVLCATCQEGKNAVEDQESSDSSRHYDPDCKFCWQREKSDVYRHGTVCAHRDGYPVSDGHHLVIPVRHTPDLFTMTERERRDADSLIRALRRKLLSEDASIAGFNVGMNCGAEAGQSIFHAHWHLIPRRKGDSSAKKGGIRGVIPERMNY